MIPTLNVDAFRYLVNLHTTIRCLSINSQIIRIIGLKNLPDSILKNIAINWSFELEKESNVYRERNGKLTENGKPTTSFKHYLTLTKELGLSQRANNIYRITRTGKILYLLLIDKNPFQFELSSYEKLFYLITLFQYDADGILVLLKIILENERILSQKQIQEMFVDKLKERLLLKQKSSDLKTKHLLLEKHKKIEFTWKKPEKYAEHIIAPRIDWLADLDILNIERSGGSNLYKVSSYGEEAYSNLPNLLDNRTKDINEEWIRTSLMKCLTNNYSNRIYWDEIAKDQKVASIDELLELASKEFGSVGSKRISFHTSFIYIAILLFVKSRIVIEKKEFEEFLLSKVRIKDKIYSVHLAARQNEEYITYKYI